MVRNWQAMEMTLVTTVQKTLAMRHGNRNLKDHLLKDHAAKMGSLRWPYLELQSTQRKLGTRLIFDSLRPVVCLQYYCFYF